MREKRNDIVMCPGCAAEYTANEIYFPNEFLGRSKDLEKDRVTHKIVFDAGKPMNPTEHFICEYCGTPFKVWANIKFYVTEDEKVNFNKDAVTVIKKKDLFLSED